MVKNDHRLNLRLISFGNKNFSISGRRKKQISLFVVTGKSSLLTGSLVLLLLYLTNRAPSHLLLWTWISFLVAIASYHVKQAIQLWQLIDSHRKQKLAEIEDKTRHIKSLLDQLTPILKNIDELPIEQRCNSKKGWKLLGSARQVTRALHKRKKEAETIILDAHEDYLSEACKLLSTQLDFDKDLSQELIGEDELPALKADDWEPTVRFLATQIKIELEAFKQAA